MKSTGIYCPIENDYDLEHEINENVRKTKDILESLNGNDSLRNETAIKKAIIETILESM